MENIPYQTTRDITEALTFDSEEDAQPVADLFNQLLKERSVDWWFANPVHRKRTGSDAVVIVLFDEHCVDERWLYLQSLRAPVGLDQLNSEDKECRQTTQSPS